MILSRRGKALSLFVLAILFAAILVGGNSVAAQGNGTIYFSPSGGQHDVGSTFSVAVRVNTDGVAINAAEGSIVYDPDRLEVRSISKSGSIFTLWTTEPAFSNADGTITFGGGVPNPGYSGAGGQVITINFRAKAVADATGISLVSGTLLANDGNGTNILQSLGRATFSIGGAAAPASTTVPAVSQPSAGSTIPMPALMSSTHPDHSVWHAHADPVFTWSVPAGVTEVRLVLADNESAIPRVKYAPAISTKSLPDVTDGTWFFRAQFVTAQGVGPVATYAFKIDTHSPEAFTINRTDDNDLTDPRPKIVFSAVDRTSGIDHYEVRVDSDLITVTPDQAGTPYALSSQVPGVHHVTVKAVDRAAHETTAALEVTVMPIAAPVIIGSPSPAGTGHTFDLSGRGTPGTRVHFFAVPAGTPPASLQNQSELSRAIGIATVDGYGNWTGRAEVSRGGTYDVYAIAEDSRGALSQPSHTVRVVITNKILEAVSGFLKHLAFGIRQSHAKWFIASSIFYVVLFSILGYLLTRMIGGLLGGIQRHRRQAIETKLPLRIRKLVEEMEEDLDLLARIARSRPLYPEEKYLRSKLVQYRKTIHFLAGHAAGRPSKKKKRALISSS
jgi:hypothetical protein